MLDLAGPEERGWGEKIKPGLHVTVKLGSGVAHGTTGAAKNEAEDVHHGKVSHNALGAIERGRCVPPTCPHRGYREKILIRRQLSGVLRCFFFGIYLFAERARTREHAGGVGMDPRCGVEASGNALFS